MKTKALLKAIRAVTDSADDTGCSGDLTVVSSAALKRLTDEFNNMPLSQREMASRGGKARMKNMSPRRRRALARKAVNARWSRKQRKKSAHVTAIFHRFKLPVRSDK